MFTLSLETWLFKEQRRLCYYTTFHKHSENLWPILKSNLPHWGQAAATGPLRLAATVNLFRKTLSMYRWEDL